MRQAFHGFSVLKTGQNSLADAKIVAKPAALPDRIDYASCDTVADTERIKAMRGHIQPLGTKKFPLSTGASACVIHAPNWVVDFDLRYAPKQGELVGDVFER